MYVSHRLRACRGHFDFVSIKARRPISRNPVWQVPTVPPKVLSSIIGLARMQRRWWRREQLLGSFLLSAGGADVKMFSAPPTALHAG